MEIVLKLLSWLHIIAATLSLIFGTYVLLRKKGDAKHVKFGLWYFYAMLVNNITSLFIFNATGKWFFPHTLAVVCLVVLLPGILAIKFKPKNWLVIHIVSMVLSYYLLIGGAINEMFLHIKPLQKYILTNDPILGFTHFGCQVFFVGILIYYLVKYRRFPKKQEVK